MHHPLSRIGWLLAGLALGLILAAFAAPATAGPIIQRYVAAIPAGGEIHSAPPGTPILILGYNLGSSGSVAFHGVPAAVVSWSAEEIQVTVPTAPSYPFTGAVTATTNDETGYGPEFTITAPPPPAPPSPPPTPTPPPTPPILRPGDLDPGFGTGGKVLTDFGGSSGAWAVAVQPNGQIVAAGDATANGKYAFALARYNGHGSLDVSFGTAGKVLTDFGGDAFAVNVALQPGGQIVAAGDATANGKEYFALARYNENGSLDLSFGSGGKVLTGFGGDSARASAVAVQPDGRIVAAGIADANGTTEFALARYNGNGSLDPSFGTGGQVLTGFGGDAFAFAVALQPNGQIVVAGYAPAANGKYDGFALARYNGDGSLDAAFGTGGRVRTDFGGDAGAFALAVQPDGQLVVAGGGLPSGKYALALARYNGNGSLDTSFGTGGQVLTGFGNTAQAFDVALQPDGQIVVAGWHVSDGKELFALARFQGR